MSDNIGDPLISKEFSLEAYNILSELKSERQKYFQNKIVCDAIKDCEVDSDLRSKINEIVVDHDLKDCLLLNTVSLGNNNKLLGVLSAGESKLSYSDTETLRKAVDQKIKYMHEETLKTLGTMNELKINTVSLNSEVFHDFFKKLQFQQQLYVKNLISLSELLDSMIFNRIEKVPKICENKIVDISMKDKMYDLRSSILDKCTRGKIFTEIPLSLESYQIVIKDIFDAQQECRAEIEELQLLKEKYKQLKCAEFDEILKSFVDYKTALEDLKQLLIKLNPKLFEINVS